MEKSMDIGAVAREFVEINHRRKELEKREEYLKSVLVEHFQATGAKHLETELGKVSFLEAQKVDYDIPLLRQALPPSVFDLVTKVSVNDAVLSQLVRDGKVDAAAVERARRVTVVYRVVAQVSQVTQAMHGPQVTHVARAAQVAQAAQAVKGRQAARGGQGMKGGVQGAKDAKGAEGEEATQCRGNAAPTAGAPVRVVAGEPVRRVADEPVARGVATNPAASAPKADAKKTGSEVGKTRTAERTGEATLGSRGARRRAGEDAPRPR